MSLLGIHAGGGQDAWDVAQLLAGDGQLSLVAEVDMRLDELPPKARVLWKRTLSS